MRLIELLVRNPMPRLLMTPQTPQTACWPHENVAYVLGIKKPTPDKRRKPVFYEAMSAGIDGRCLRHCKTY